MPSYDLGTVLTLQEAGLALPAINTYLGVTDCQIATPTPPSPGNSILNTTVTVSPAQLTTIQNQITAYRQSISDQNFNLQAKLNAVKTQFNGRLLTSLTATEKQTLAFAFIVWQMAELGWLADNGNTIQIP